jgi:hypothetical protein
MLAAMRGGSGLLAIWAALVAPCAASAGAARCWIDHGAVVASAAFGAIAGDFVIDLSRPVSALSVTRANAEGITADVTDAPLSLAGRRWPAARLAVADLDAETRDFDTTINGVLGWDVLGAGPLELDLRHGGCALRLGAVARLHGARRLPYVLVLGAPAVRAAVSDGLTTTEGLFLLDTARTETRVTGAEPAKAVPPADADIATFRLRALSVAGCLFENLAASPEPAADAAGALGLGVLTGGRLRIDPARKTVEFDPCRP